MLNYVKNLKNSLVECDKAIFLVLYNYIKIAMPDLDQNTWKSKLKSEKDFLIIDVRTAEEFEELRIPESINIDFYNPQNFIQELEKLDKSKSYYIYCRTGSRSANTCELMKEMGFSNSYNLLGGITEWKGEVEGQSIS